MNYLRFVRPNLVEGLNHREGIFCAAYELRDEPDIAPHTSEELERLLDWFGKNLKRPKRFNKTKSKGYYRRKTIGLSWYKEDAADMIQKSFKLVQILSDNGFPIDIIRTDRVGYIIYEDVHQVVAEPFADTPV